MDNAIYFIKGRRLGADDRHLQAALAEVYGTPERPRCMCVRGGVDMYIVKLRHYILKRMPGSGPSHHPGCDSYEPEFTQSGLGILMGDAVIEHPQDLTELRVDFPLARAPGRAVPQRDPAPASDVKVPKHRMSLRAVMHFLFERAGFNRWSPAMEGKRNQYVLHKYLMEAADGMRVKGDPLSARLYVPEAFSEQRKSEIAERRRSKLAILKCPEEEGRFNMALVLGEYKSTESTSYGRKIWIRHMPETPLFINDKAWTKIERNFSGMFQARDADQQHGVRLLLCALVYSKQENVYHIDTVSPMLTTMNWIPLDGPHESKLFHYLTVEKRKFLKPLSYDAKGGAGFANALLLDTGTTPVPLHLTNPLASSSDHSAKERAIASATEAAWIWHAEAEAPPLPPRFTANTRPGPQRPPGDIDLPPIDG